MNSNKTWNRKWHAIRFPEQTLARIEKIAEIDGEPLTVAARQLMREALDAREKREKQYAQGGRQ